MVRGGRQAFHFHNENEARARSLVGLEVVAQFAEREIAAIPFTIPSFSLFKWDETAIADEKD